MHGRAGEEVIYFRARGFEPVVIPGVSSVLAGPTFAGIPVAQRGAAESFIVCTGVGARAKKSSCQDTNEAARSSGRGTALALQQTDFKASLF